MNTAYLKFCSPNICFKANNPCLKALRMEELTHMNIKNLRFSGASIASGETLSPRPQQDFEKIKALGVDTIVDYRGDSTSDLAQKCSESGIQYINFPLDGVDTLNNETYFGMTSDNKRYVKDTFINMLREYFSVMNTQNVYAGCQYGIDRTNVGLVLNFLINPEAVNNEPQILTWPDESKKSVINKLTKMAKKILRAMSSEQKKTLGLSDRNNDFTNTQIKKLLSSYKTSIGY